VDTAVRSDRYSPKSKGIPNEECDPFGRGICALMVDPSYSPHKLRKAAATGGAVAAVAVVKGQTPDPSSPPKMLHFSGYDWLVRDFIKLSRWLNDTRLIRPTPGPMQNGALHLRATENQDGWSCAGGLVRHVRALTNRTSRSGCAYMLWTSAQLHPSGSSFARDAEPICIGPGVADQTRSLSHRDSLINRVLTNRNR